MWSKLRNIKVFQRIYLSLQEDEVSFAILCLELFNDLINIFKMKGLI
jgi:hypothetical protein